MTRKSLKYCQLKDIEDFRASFAKILAFGPIVLFKIYCELPMIAWYADALLLPTPRKESRYAARRAFCQ
jgi:hypothetical protein